MTCDLLTVRPQRTTPGPWQPIHFNLSMPSSNTDTVVWTELSFRTIFSFIYHRGFHAMNGERPKTLEPRSFGARPTNCEFGIDKWPLFSLHHYQLLISYLFDVDQTGSDKMWITSVLQMRWINSEHSDNTTVRNTSLLTLNWWTKLRIQEGSFIPHSIGAYGSITLS
jgi:hypothetical protein